MLMDNADISIGKECAGAELGTDVIADYASFEIKSAIAQAVALLVELAHEAQLNTRRLLVYLADQPRSKGLGEAVASAHREGTFQGG